MNTEIKAAQDQLSKLTTKELRAKLKASRRVVDVRDSDKWTCIAALLQDRFGRKAMAAFYE